MLSSKPFLVEKLHFLRNIFVKRQQTVHDCAAMKHLFIKWNNMNNIAGIYICPHFIFFSDQTSEEVIY